MTKYYRDTKYDIRQNIQPKIAPLTAAVSGALAAGSLQAATITVDTLNDGLNSGECTLRSALYSSTRNAASNGCAAGEAGEDTIVFDSSLSGTITLGTSGLYYDGSTLPIGESVTIDGGGDITVQGTGNAPVLYSKYDSTDGYNTESLSVYGLTITGGGGAEGGGILSRGRNLSLTSTTITGNTAADGGGGVWHEPFIGYGDLSLLTSQFTNNTVTGAGDGGGIGMRAPDQAFVDIAGSTFSGNQAQNGFSGGLHLFTEDLTQVELKYNIFDGNYSSEAGGGAFLNVGYAQVDLTDNVFTGNETDTIGGGLAIREVRADLQQAEITFDGNEFTNNFARSEGGGAFVLVENGDQGSLADPLKFIRFTGGNRFESNDAYLTSGALALIARETISVELEDVDFVGNSAGQIGGGAMRAVIVSSELTIANSSFVDNRITTYSTDLAFGGAAEIGMSDGRAYLSGVLAEGNRNYTGEGGAIAFNAGNSEIGVEYSTLINNEASECGGAMSVRGADNQVGVGHSVLYGNQARCGGAVALVTTGGSTGATIAEFKYNEMSFNNANGASNDDGGGAIFSDLYSGSSVFLENSTISANTSDSVGGGVQVSADNTLEVKYATLADNSAQDDGGAIYNSASSCSVGNTVFGGNSRGAGVGQSLAGTVNCSVADSLLENATNSDYNDGGGNLLDVAPQIGPLADNGGNAGYTHALLGGSPAIDAGNAGSQVPDSDQRGAAYPRVQGSALDMGAFELGPPLDAIFGDRFEQP